jgi:Fic family protein
MHGATDGEGQYLHWEELRRRPVPDGLNHLQTWGAMKLARRRLLKRLPFIDKHGVNFTYAEPDRIRRELRFLDLYCAGNLSIGKTLSGESENQAYLARSILEEPISSSILEGAATTRARAREMIEQQQKPRDQSEQMILNNYLAMQEIAHLKDEPLSVELVLHIHRTITEGTLDNPAKSGVFRDAADEIDVVDNLGNILHHPPDANELKQRMSLLCDFANGSEQDEPFLHPIVRAMILHFMLAYDHPFVDGNGRVARALFYWSVLRSGYWIMKYVSISHFIQKASGQYGMAFLKVETDDADMTYFLDNQLGVLRLAVVELQKYLERQQKKFQAFESLLRANRDYKFNLRQTTLLKEFVKGHIMKVIIGDHQKRFNVSYLTARKDLEDLVSAQLLQKNKIGRQSIYIANAELAQKLASKTVPQIYK